MCYVLQMITTMIGIQNSRYALYKLRFKEQVSCLADYMGYSFFRRKKVKIFDGVDKECPRAPLRELHFC